MVLAFLLGFGFCLFLEPFIINFVYFSNIDLFIDSILFKKNRNKLLSYFKIKNTKGD